MLCTAHKKKNQTETVNFMVTERSTCCEQQQQIPVGSRLKGKAVNLLIQTQASNYQQHF